MVLAKPQSQEAHTLYLLSFASGKHYVGQTVRTMNARLQQHRAAARRGSELPVHCAWRKYGEPDVRVLGEFESHAALHQGEIDAIARLGTVTPGGYNVTVGGDTAPSKSPEVARKIAERAKGRRHADTTVWSEALRARWTDPAYREQVAERSRQLMTPERRGQQAERSRAMWERRRAEGWVMPEATREKIRARVFSDEARAKMSESAKRRGIPPEQRAKIVASQKGKPRAEATEEKRRNLSSAVKAAWADPIKRERLMAARKAAWETRRRQQQVEAL